MLQDQDQDRRISVSSGLEAKTAVSRTTGLTVASFHCAVGKFRYLKKLGYSHLELCPKNSGLRKFRHDKSIALSTKLVVVVVSDVGLRLRPTPHLPFYRVMPRLSSCTHLDYVGEFPSPPFPSPLEVGPLRPGVWGAHKPPSQRFWAEPGRQTYFGHKLFKYAPC